MRLQKRQRKKVNKEKTKKDIESIIYVIFCILSLGSLWLTRIVITKGMLYAMRQKAQEDAAN